MNKQCGRPLIWKSTYQPISKFHECLKGHKQTCNSSHTSVYILSNLFMPKRTVCSRKLHHFVDVKILSPIWAFCAHSHLYKDFFENFPWGHELSPFCSRSWTAKSLQINVHTLMNILHFNLWVGYVSLVPGRWVTQSSTASVSHTMIMSLKWN